MAGAAIIVSLQQLKALLGITHLSFHQTIGLVHVLTSVFHNTNEVYDQEVNTWVEMPVGMDRGWLVREAGTKLSVTDLMVLNLSHNSLNGPVPGFLAKLPSLRVLNLTGNNLTGSLPNELVRRLEDSSLLISCDRNPNLRCHEKKKNKFIVPLVESAAAISFTFLIALVIWLRLKRRKEQAFGYKRNDSLELKSRSFAYSEILRITDNFKRVLGKGGFGTVYHGYLGDTQVAVKTLSSSSTQGYEFQAEITLLLRVHHRNLINFVGYCNEGAKKGLIYEYMANGNLQQNLLDRNASNLSWEGRLRIAMDAAQGLEYLHHGCKPPIVHRDIKPANILLNEKFDANEHVDT